jgi:hypothetical protein
LVPPEFQNVLLCGRMIDAEPGAFGAARVMVNLNQLGEAAGVAAYLSLASGLAAPSVPSEELRSALAKGGSIIL